MCRKRPRGHAGFPAPNSMPFGALVLLRTPDNRFFGKSIRASRACKPAIFLPHRLRCAIRRQSAYSRKADRSTASHRQSRTRGDPQEIQHTVEEKSTPAADGNKFRRSYRRTGLRCHRHACVIPRRCTRNLQSRAAIPLDLSAPNPQRREQAALAQSARSSTGIREISGGAGKDLTHRAEDDRRKSSANPRELSAFPPKDSSEMLQHGRKIAILPWRRDKTRSNHSHGVCARPTCCSSFLRRRVTKKLLVPTVVVMIGPGARDVAANHRAKRSALHSRAHIHMDDEERHREQEGNGVNKNGDLTHNVQIPGNVLRKPQNES